MLLSRPQGAAPCLCSACNVDVLLLQARPVPPTSTDHKHASKPAKWGWVRRRLAGRRSRSPITTGPKDSWESMPAFLEKPWNEIDRSGAKCMLR